MTPLSAVICDMDGLLVDSEPLYKVAWQAAAEQLGYGLPDPFYETLIGITESHSEQRLLARFGGAFPLPQFRATWREIWRRLLMDGELRAKPGAKAMLEAVRKSPARLALATSSGAGFTRISLERVGFEGYFEHIVTAEDARHGKPEPDLYFEAARRLAVVPEQCLVLEDSPPGVLAGLAAGMLVVVVPDLQQLPAAIAVRTMGVFESLDAASPHVLRAIGET
jgi:HAD superfamily hydrolase (TIGR01509 family)